MKRLIFLSALFCGTIAHSALLNVQQLNQKIEKSGGEWVASNNHLTALSKGEIQRYMGLQLQGASEVQFIAPVDLSLKSALPSSVDWRNKDGKNWVSPIMDQANCGSCVAFATVGVLETQYKISSLFPNFNIKLSPQHLFSCGGGSCESGWRPEKAARFIQRYGIPDEACMPYQSGSTGEDISCRQTCSDSQQRSIGISEYSTPTRGYEDVDAVKRALQQGPVVTNMKVFPDFAAYAGGVYHHTTGDVLGGHAVSIVGYDDDKQAFIIRNSWGTAWGEKGFAYVGYGDDSGVGEETWQYTISPMSGGVSLVSPDNYAYFTKTASINAFSSYAATDSLTVVVYGLENKVVQNLNCASARCSQELDVSSLPDGRYEAQVFAMNSKGEKIGNSERHIFYVANSSPKLEISFKGMKSDIFSRPLRDMVQVDIDAYSSSVPMSSLEFHRRGPDGKEQVKSAPIVPAKMAMGWRTNLIPNGQYEIWFVGHLKTNGLDVSVESTHKTVTVRN
ncbi:MAG: C1 family peptidase [Bdellovibrio sp.]